MGTENVKLGVCNAFFGGNDLGYTKGGVEVEVSTNTYGVMVDQFGESEINEYITKRTVKIKCPLAETSLENMVSVMPGATLIDNGTKQVYTVDIDAVSANATESITIDGRVASFTMDATPTEGEVAIGLVDIVNSTAGMRMVATTTALAADLIATVVLTAKTSGYTSTLSVSANLSSVQTTAALVGSKRVDVANGIGSDLLLLAKELILHPKGLPASDKSEDFIVPLASTAGSLQFAYKTDEERVFNVEFTGYPDNSNNDTLFKFGDPDA